MSVDVREFERGYLRALLWAETDGDAPLDANYTAADLAPETRERLRTDCESFCARYGHLLGDEDAYRAGVDFLLTRNRHGAGYWDGDWPAHGDELTAAAHTYPELAPYVGDDGRLYVV